MDLASIALTAGLIVAGASGATIIQTPTAWPRTIPAFGLRVADQTGFYVVKTGSTALLNRALGWQPDTARCPRAGLVGCAVVRTFRSYDREGTARFNVPRTAGIVLGTGVSALWRPERSDNAKTWAFVGTRLGIVVTGYVAERVFVDWWAGRNAK